MNSLKKNLLNYAFDRGIGVYFLPLEPDMPPVVDTDKRMVVVNSKWRNKKEIPLQIAHEISHIINEDKFDHSIHTEGCANKTALKLIIPYYFADIDFEDVNVSKFMEDVCLPPYVEDEAVKQIKEYYKTKI